MPWRGRVLEQSHAQSCGYCCVGMVIKLLDPTYSPTEQSLVSAGKRLDPSAYDRAAKDRVGVAPTPIHAAYRHVGALPHWGSGTYGNHLAAVLDQGYQIDARFHQGVSPKNAMRSVTTQRPMIVLVHWAKGGGHWVVVVARKTRGLGQPSDYTILDPGGHEVTNRGSSTYKAPYGSTGTFGNYFVTIHGKKAMSRGPKLPGM